MSMVTVLVVANALMCWMAYEWGRCTEMIKQDELRRDKQRHPCEWFDIKK